MRRAGALGFRELALLSVLLGEALTAFSSLAPPILQSVGFDFYGFPFSVWGEISGFYAVSWISLGLNFGFWWGISILLVLFLHSRRHNKEAKS